MGQGRSSHARTPKGEGARRPQSKTVGIDYRSPLNHAPGKEGATTACATQVACDGGLGGAGRLGPKDAQTLKRAATRYNSAQEGQGKQGCRDWGATTTVLQPLMHVRARGAGGTSTTSMEKAWQSNGSEHWQHLASSVCAGQGLG